MLVQDIKKALLVIILLRTGRNVDFVSQRVHVNLAIKTPLQNMAEKVIHQSNN